MSFSSYPHFNSCREAARDIKRAVCNAFKGYRLHKKAIRISYDDDEPLPGNLGATHMAHVHLQDNLTTWSQYEEQIIQTLLHRGMHALACDKFVRPLMQPSIIPEDVSAILVRVEGLRYILLEKENTTTNHEAHLIIEIDARELTTPAVTDITLSDNPDNPGTLIEWPYLVFPEIFKLGISTGLADFLDSLLRNK
jgi:hypothetical protein